MDQICQVCRCLLSTTVQTSPRLHCDEGNAVEGCNLRQHIGEQASVIVCQGEVDVQVVGGGAPARCLGVVGNDGVLIEVQGHTNKGTVAWGKVRGALPWDAHGGRGGNWAGAGSGNRRGTAGCRAGAATSRAWAAALGGRRRGSTLRGGSGDSIPGR